MSVTIIPWIVVTAFGAVFIYAAVREILHRREHGPPENPRDAFDFDQAAPSYEEPESTDPDPPDPDDVAETDEDPDAAPPERDSSPDKPDKSEAPDDRRHDR